jgi:hypothetical protein
MSTVNTNKFSFILIQIIHNICNIILILIIIIIIITFYYHIFITIVIIIYIIAFMPWVINIEIKYFLLTTLT